MTSVSAAALHGLDRADTQRKFDLMLQRIKSMTKVMSCSRPKTAHFAGIQR